MLFHQTVVLRLEFTVFGDVKMCKLLEGITPSETVFYTYLFCDVENYTVSPKSTNFETV